MTDEEEYEYIRYRLNILENGNDNLFSPGPATEEYQRLSARLRSLYDQINTPAES